MKELILMRDVLNYVNLAMLERCVKEVGQG